MLLLFQIRELVPESQAYMDLLAFERKLDQTIMRKRVDIQEALKRPMKVPWCGGRKRALCPVPRTEKRGCPGGGRTVCSVGHSLSLQQKRKLRLYISNTFNPAKPDAEDSDGSIASWELRVEGKLLDDVRPRPRSLQGSWGGYGAGLRTAPDVCSKG